ncbi:hypothetical protein R3Q06_21900 [Rhodococcus erythropolis]|uniref:hypothetical protein n=1 Tax=Rhodococcus erythropolis TaxID=1833 RepID=UPI002949C0C9|nr:hypothetical protein [Rhodococcus erythropolis]MDV6276156.1 hypothetical protein [Rhodococcus erythropolis]
MADVLGDRKVVEVLDRAVWGINPVLDLAYSDPLGIKRRTFEPTDPERNAAAMVLDAAAWVLDVVKFPGTAAWSVMTDEQRSKWWTTRLGALNTVAVAFPGIFGVLLNRLPIQDLLAFANQAVVLVAVAREHGVTERDQQVDLLASVLCRRETKSRDLLAGEDFAEKSVSGTDETWRPFALIGTLWRTSKTFRAITDELHKRPSRTKPYEILGKIPVVGVVADYLGERGALVRAAALGEKWIAIRSRNITAVG